MNQLIKAFKNLANLSSEWSVEVQIRFVLVKNYIRIMQHPFYSRRPWISKAQSLPINRERLSLYLD